jgi:dTDP-4-amino-4,6-dideoxygalactose transaminase
MVQTSTRGHRSRKLALLGGSTTARDCIIALGHILIPRRLVDGPDISAYEVAFAKVVDSGHAISFAAGRVGLYGILKAAGIGAGDEVLLQVPTHIVVANAIRYTGARPVYVDCELDSYNIDLDQADAQVTPRTRALILQHTFGIPVDMDRAAEIASRSGLLLIEDCVHALGARYRGRPVGSLGAAAFFSTEETKTISTTMGGMVTTGDPALAEKVRSFQASCSSPSASTVIRYLLKLVIYYLLTEPSVHRYSRAAYELLGRRHPLPRPTVLEELQGRKPPGYERRFSNGQAAVALEQLRKLSRNLAHRRRAADGWEHALRDHGFRLPKPPEGAEPAYVRYPVWVDDRERVVQALGSRLVVGTWFTSVLEEALDPAVGDYVAGSCPRAEEAARHLINLPTHGRVSSRDVAEISEMLISTAPTGIPSPAA